jgi:hypothetical protein
MDPDFLAELGLGCDSVLQAFGEGNADPEFTIRNPS